MDVTAIWVWSAVVLAVTLQNFALLRLLYPAAILWRLWAFAFGSACLFAGLLALSRRAVCALVSGGSC